MAEQEDQYRSTPLPLRADHVAPVPSSDAGGRTTVPPASDSRPDATPSLTLKIGTDVVAVDAAEARAQVASAVLRPVEEMLRDPLGDVARKERRSLLGISAIAILVGWTGLVPAKIQNFGITFAPPERQALLWVFSAVVWYYLFAFAIYSLSDILSYGYAVHRGREELRRQSLSPSGEPSEPWPLVNWVTPTSLARATFDFVVPVLIAAFALWSLWGAVHQVAPKGSGGASTEPQDAVSLATGALASATPSCYSASIASGEEGPRTHAATAMAHEGSSIPLSATTRNYHDNVDRGRVLSRP
jgi:hypothetical protein